MCKLNLVTFWCNMIAREGFRIWLNLGKPWILKVYIDTESKKQKRKNKKERNNENLRFLFYNLGANLKALEN